MKKYRTLPKLTREQYRKVKKQTDHCCNKDQGNCLLLDRGETVPCIQAISLSVNCKYFRNAVLPLDETLAGELFPGNTKRQNRKCVVCGKAFSSKAPNAKYCRACANVVHRKQKAESERKRRARGHSGRG